MQRRFPNVCVTAVAVGQRQRLYSGVGIFAVTGTALSRLLVKQLTGSGVPLRKKGTDTVHYTSQITGYSPGTPGLWLVTGSRSDQSSKVTSFTVYRP